MVTNKTKQTEFDTFVDHLYDKIFQESADYLSNCIGEDCWGEELHETHGIIMYNAIKELAKSMKINE